MTKLRPRRRLDPPAMNHELNHDNLSYVLPGLTRLAEQLLRSRVHQDDPWLNSLSASDLAPLGLRLTDLRTLHAQGYIEARGPGVRNQRHIPRTEKRRTKESPRRDGSSAPAQQPIGPRTLFIFTDAGLAYLMTHVHATRGEPAPTERGQAENAVSANGSSTAPVFPSPAISHIALLPHYNSELRELSVADVVVLRIPVQGHNLAAVLRTLELSGWKPRVDKPLNGRPDGAEPAHIANAAYSLNVRQSLIDFHADGGAIRWEWRASGNAAGHASQNRSSNGSTRRQP